MKSKNAYVIIIIGLIFQMIFYGFFVDETSFGYSSYVSGEYYFRARAKTTQPDDSLLLNTNLDTTQTKNILLLSSGAEVYAYNPHGPYCTVEYGDEVVQDFPLNRLSFLTDEDKAVFNGTKFTEEEYNAYIKKIAADSSLENRLSDKEMLPQNKGITFPVIVLVYSVAMGIALYCTRDDEITSEIILVAWIMLSILFDIVYVNIV